MYLKYFSLLLLSAQLTRQLEFECIENIEDFSANNWIAQGNTLHSANSSSDLPTPLQGHDTLDGVNGVMYFRGGGKDLLRTGTGRRVTPKWPTPPGNLQYLWRDGYQGQGNGSTFIYIKYYAHIETPTEDRYAIAFPTRFEDQQRLPDTSDFNWREITVELDPKSVSDGDEVGFTAISFESSDYLVVDRIAIGVGETGSGIEDLSRLCFPDVSFPPTTTVTEDESTTESVTEPSAECKEAGFKAHPGDCSKFHVCLYDTFGSWGDLLFTCPAPQVWCQQSQQCQSASACPCVL